MVGRAPIEPTPSLVCMNDWTFFTNHGHVLWCIARDPDIRHRDLATRVGITERAVQRIVADLVDAGYLSITKAGRRNRYQLHPEMPLRHPVEHENRVGDILHVMRIADHPQ